MTIKTPPILSPTLPSPSTHDPHAIPDGFNKDIKRTFVSKGGRIRHRGQSKMSKEEENSVHNSKNNLCDNYFMRTRTHQDFGKTTCCVPSTFSEYKKTIEHQRFHEQSIVDKDCPPLKSSNSQQDVVGTADDHVPRKCGAMYIVGTADDDVLESTHEQQRFVGSVDNDNDEDSMSESGFVVVESEGAGAVEMSTTAATTKQETADQSRPRVPAKTALGPVTSAVLK